MRSLRSPTYMMIAVGLALVLMPSGYASAQSQELEPRLYQNSPF